VKIRVLAVALFTALIMAPLSALIPQAQAVNCKRQVGFNPYCFPKGSMPLFAKGFHPDGTKFCYGLQNTGPKTKVAAMRLGHPSGAFHKVGHGKVVVLCVKTEGKCPKVNVRSSNGEVDTNLGTYPSCDSSWRVPTTKQAFVLCRTNDSGVPKTLALFRGDTLMSLKYAKPGKRVCVSRSFHKLHKQHLTVRWYKEDGRPVRQRSILLNAVFRANKA